MKIRHIYYLINRFQIVTSKFRDTNIYISLHNSFSKTRSFFAKRIGNGEEGFCFVQLTHKRSSYWVLMVIIGSSWVLRTVKILLCKARFSSFSFEYTSARYANVLSHVSLQRNNEKSLIIPLQIIEIFLKSKSFGVLYSWKAINFRMKTLFVSAC